MKRILTAIILVTASAAGAAETDKTLVSWVVPADKNLRAGSVLTIQSEFHFDGIVFTGGEPGRWISGSNESKRTEKNQSEYPPETARGGAMVQMAIVYKDDNISIYRNGELYRSYQAENFNIFTHKRNTVAVFGVLSTYFKGSFDGAIEDARIYSKALSIEEIKSLRPNKASVIKPYAWWDFQGDKVVDRAGRYPFHRLNGGAKLAGGKLVLGKDGALIAALSEAEVMVLEPDQPKWPENPPSDWLTFHLAHPSPPGRSWPGDPNPAFYYKGRYHLHYIYKNDLMGESYGHVSSKDMVHWKWHPTTLNSLNMGHGMFSGTGFFTKEGRPAMIYHGQWSGLNWVSYGLDDNLNKWGESDPVIAKTADGKVVNIKYWDPDCWIKDGTYYALSGGHDPDLMKSTDLKNWLHLGKLMHDDYPDDLGISRREDVSCANMFKIGNKWMLLCISHPLGCRYYLGDFKDEKYLPEFHAMMNWQTSSNKLGFFFAPESLLTKDGRRVMWAWIVKYKDLCPSGVQSLPRELELPADGVLRIKPLRELASLRYNEKMEKNITVMDNSSYLLNEISGDALELKVEFKASKAKEFGIDVLGDETGQNGLRIAVIGESKTLRVGTVNAPFKLKQGEDLILRVFVDKNLVEVFANDRQAVAALQDTRWIPATTRLFSKGSDLQVNKLTAWKMKSIYQGNTVFNGN